MSEDRVAQILRYHVEISERQLAFVRGGVAFSDVADVVPTNEADLLLRIEQLESALRRHEMRTGRSS